VVRIHPRILLCAQVVFLFHLNPDFPFSRVAYIRAGRYISKLVSPLAVVNFNQAGLEPKVFFCQSALSFKTLIY